ncbi:hypothetical protein GCM10009535_31360 [Streptomyces thermocarboxydovorans]|uniref:Uncharacterized protein n=1 Tax=Streptomyces thermocarboxydovorans TaxID=59298 RepID=A0ABN1HI38_9ACTN|nr:hypothetical protein [Streptomyces composti]
MDASTGIVGHFVGRVLDEFEKLAVTVSALRDTTFTVRVLGHETGVDGVGLQDARRLLQDGFDDRRVRGRHG